MTALVCTDLEAHCQSHPKRTGILFSLEHLVCFCQIKQHILQIALINNQAGRGKNIVPGIQGLSGKTGLRISCSKNTISKLFVRDRGWNNHFVLVRDLVALPFTVLQTRVSFPSPPKQVSSRERAREEELGLPCPSVAHLRSGRCRTTAGSSRQPWQPTGIRTAV